MRYKVYKKAVKKLTTEPELRRLLNYAENDLQNISSIQYENIRFLVINKIYSYRRIFENVQSSN